MVYDFLDTPYGPIAKHFKCAKLIEVCTENGVQTGPFGSQLHKKDYVSEGTPIFTVEHLGENRIIHDENMPRVTEADRKRLAKYSLRVGDIVFSRVGSVDCRALIRDEEDGWLFSGRCLRVRPNNKIISSKYLSWFFGLPGFKEHIRKIAVGATMPSLNTKILSDAPVYFPSADEQKAIAQILCSLDDKIELNRRMNQTLEAIARAIFKSWFVDFDPVRAKAEGKPPQGISADVAKLFPESFEDSELGKIPKGWKVGCIGDIAENPRRGIQPSEIEAGTPYIGLEHMPRKSLSLNKWGTADEVASNKFKFHSGEILFGKLRPYFHKVGVAVLNGVCSTDILVIKEKILNWFSYILFCVSSNNFIDYTDAHSTGTKMPRTNWKDMSSYKVVLPPDKLVEAFDRTIAPTVIVIRSNIVQSRTLASIRDVLLPKLLSGEIRVKV